MFIFEVVMRRNAALVESSSCDPELIVIVVMFAPASLLPNKHPLPCEIEALSKGQRLDLPYSKEEIKLSCRIPAAWRVKLRSADRVELALHFEVLKGISPHY
jgi:hypothetical protein